MRRQGDRCGCIQHIHQTVLVVLSSSSNIVRFYCASIMVQYTMTVVQSQSFSYVVVVYPVNYGLQNRPYFVICQIPNTAKVHRNRSRIRSLPVVVSLHVRTVAVASSRHNVGRAPRDCFYLHSSNLNARPCGTLRTYGSTVFHLCCSRSAF